MPAQARRRRQEAREGRAALDESPRAEHALNPPTVLAILGALLALASVFVFFAVNAPKSGAAADPVGYNAAPPAPKGAEVVYVGIEPINVFSVSLERNDFQTSFYIWWRWRGRIDPTATTDILNSTPSANYYITLYSFTNAAGHEKPIRLKDGEMYQTAKISVGVSDPLSINRYPLDNQVLRIRVENNTYDYSQLVYMPDTANMSHSPTFDVDGWNLTGVTVGQYLHQYGTNFGVIDQSLTASQYSQLTYDIGVVRPFSHFLMKLFLPMFVVLLAGLSSLFVKPDDFDVRLAMAGTGLLTLIFLQMGYAADLPSTSPVVLMDEIYALAYAAVGATFLRVVYTTTRLHHSDRSASSFVRPDRTMALITAAGFLIGSTILVAL